MKVAITGGSGVVGAAVTRHLVDAGHQVRALARSDSSVAILIRLGAEVTRGELLDYAGLTRLVAGCDLVFNVAGVNELCPRDRDHMWRVNVEGARLIADACREQGVPKLIHTSSAVTIGEVSGTVGSETTLHRGSYLSEYERTKTEAERFLLESSGDLEVVAVNPSSVQGPGRATGTGRLLLDVVRGKLPFLVDTSLSIVDIDDCARGHLLAAENGLPGERYILSGASLTMRDALTLLAKVLDREPKVYFIRPWALRLVARVVEGVSRAIARQPTLCSESARVLVHGHRYDGSKATRDLGLGYVPVEDTLRRTVDWFGAEGLV